MNPRDRCFERGHHIDSYLEPKKKEAPPLYPRARLFALFLVAIGYMAVAVHVPFSGTGANFGSKRVRNVSKLGGQCGLVSAVHTDHSVNIRY